MTNKLSNYRDFQEAFIEELSKNKKRRRAYLKLSYEEFKEEGDLPSFLLALRTIAMASGGIGELAKQTNLTRQAIYKALSAKGNPSFTTLSAIIKSLGFELKLG